ncbi:MAG TPA: LysR substrate-binding domain-containing protein [Kofleriaceae bacterium]|jgi:DNA-binding transcriptional LysR family regulator|nr:LysR substrate-binding domain-containing protein [Kofleriaceae bacterium]
MERSLQLPDLSEIGVFVKVVQTGSFSQAARDLGLPKSTVSRKVSQLEERLGARLLQRTTRKVALTEVGAMYHERCARILPELEDAERAVTELQDVPRGLLRVAAPSRFDLLGPVVAEMLAKFPDVRVEVVCSDRVVDLIDEGFDVAIRAGSLSDGSLIARRLMDSIPHVIVAAPSYVEAHGSPDSPDELADHECLIFSGNRDRSTWRFKKGGKQVEVQVTGRCSINDFDLLRQAALAGHGIARLPAQMACPDLRDERLVRVMTDWNTTEVPLSIVYPSTRHLSPKVRAFIDLARQRLTPAKLSEGVD